MDYRLPRPLRYLAVAIAAILLAACGGGDGSGGTTPVVGTGVLSDAPVQGVAYSAASYSGNTDASGEFSYKAGETITFKLGALTLGVATGSGSAMTVTPLQLVEGSTGITDPVQRQNAVTNLLVLLQSLDNNPDPARITIAPAAITALQDPGLAAALAALLTDTPANFSASGSFTGLVATAGTTAVTADVALAHFRSEFLSSLAGQYYGDRGGHFMALRVRDDGSYLLTEIADGDAGAAPLFTKGGQPGVERGVLDWDPATGQVTATTDLDTNGSRGFSAIDAVNAPLQMAVDAGALVLTQRDAAGAVTGTDRLARLADAASGSGGTWIKTDGASLSTAMYFFLPGGEYVLVDPVGDTSLHYGTTSVTCGSRGVERGSYRLLSGMLEFLAASVDSNGCAGAHDPTSGAYAVRAQYLDSAAGTWQWGALSDGQVFQRPDNTVPVAP